MKRLGLVMGAIAALYASSSAAYDPNLREVLSDSRYRFCHEQSYPLFPEERAWCPLLGEHSSVCPALPAACRANVAPEPEEWSLSPRRGERQGGPSPDDERRAAEKKRSWSLPSGMSAIAQILFWGLVIGGVLALLWIIIKNSMRGKDEPEASQEPRAPDEAEPALPNRLVETDVERLLARARAAAARGDYEEAIESAYAAALRRLEGDGVIDMHASRTNGDYLRLLRERPDLASAMRDIVRDVERVQFGASQASASLFESVLARVIPVATRVAMLVLIVLAGMQSSCDPEREGGGRGGSSRGGTSPSGSHAVIELLKKEGLEAGYRTEPLDRLDDSVGVLLMLPGAGPEDNNWKPIFEWVKKGGRLVLAGQLPPPEDLELAVVEDDAKNTALIPAGIYYYRFDMRTGQMPPGFALRIPASVHDVEPVLTRDQPDGPHYAVHQLRDLGEVVVFADERLFTNIALTVDHNSELVMDLLRDTGKIEIVDPWTEAGADTPLESVHNAGLTALIVQLLLLLLLYVLWRGVIFGTPRDPEQRTRRSFAEHVRAVGTQYARAEAGSHALGAYSAWALERLRERLPKGRQLSLDALAMEVAARSGRDPAEVSRLLHEAQAASDATAPGSFRPESLRLYAEQAGQPARAEQRIQVVNELTALLASLGGARR